MTLSAEPRRPMTDPGFELESKMVINLRTLQALTDEWNRQVLHFGRELELLADTIPFGELELWISGNLIPRVKDTWNEHISNHVVQLWGLDRTNQARLRYSCDQFIGAIHRYAARPRRS